MVDPCGICSYCTIAKRSDRKNAFWLQSFLNFNTVLSFLSNSAEKCIFSLKLQLCLQSHDEETPGIHLQLQEIHSQSKIDSYLHRSTSKMRDCLPSASESTLTPLSFQYYLLLPVGVYWLEEGE